MERLKSFPPFVGEPQEQDFGDEFSFEEDSGALQSILNNQGFSPLFYSSSLFSLNIKHEG